MEVLLHTLAALLGEQVISVLITLVKKLKANSFDDDTSPEFKDLVMRFKQLSIAVGVEGFRKDTGTRYDVSTYLTSPAIQGYMLLFAMSLGRWVFNKIPGLQRLRSWFVDTIQLVFKSFGQLLTWLVKTKIGLKNSKAGGMLSLVGCVVFVLALAKLDAELGRQFHTLQVDTIRRVVDPTTHRLDPIQWPDKVQNPNIDNKTILDKIEDTYYLKPEYTLLYQKNEGVVYTQYQLAYFRGLTSFNKDVTLKGLSAAKACLLSQVPGDFVRDPVSTCEETLRSYYQLLQEKNMMPHGIFTEYEQSHMRAADFVRKLGQPRTPSQASALTGYSDSTIASLTSGLASFGLVVGGLATAATGTLPVAVAIAGTAGGKIALDLLGSTLSYSADFYYNQRNQAWSGESSLATTWKTYMSTNPVQGPAASLFDYGAIWTSQALSSYEQQSLWRLERLATRLVHGVQVGLSTETLPFYIHYSIFVRTIWW